MLETKESTLPEWLMRTHIVGSDNEPEFQAPENNDDGNEEDSDEDGDDDDGDEEGSEDDSDDDDSEDDDSDSDDSKGKKKKDEDDDPAKPLKSALRKERKAHKAERRQRIAFERENKELKAKQAAGTEKESEAISDLQKQLNETQSANKALAGKVREGAVRSAIIEEARKQGFIDPEDALSVASVIEVDQDEEDPTDIDIDEDSVKTAVKSLATKKKHLVGVENNTSQTKSGSKQTRRKTTKKSDKGFDPVNYPSLR